MIAEFVERRAALRQMWLIWLVIAAGLVLAGIFLGNRHLLTLAVAPLALEVACFFTRPAPFAVYFDVEGIEVHAPVSATIPYNRIEAVCAKRADIRQGSESFSFALVHRHGILNFPSKLTASSGAIYQFLRTHLSEDDLLGPPFELLPYLERCEQAYGVDGVRDYRCLPDPRPETNWLGLSMSLAAIFTGVIWMIVGEQGREYDAWTGAGGLALVLGFLGLLLWAAHYSRARGDSRFTDGGIIITPDGFALKQNNLCGQMRWDEVRDIRFRYETRQIQVKFDGGRILLRDVYDGKLRRIFFRLVDGWDGVLYPEAANGEPPA